MIVEGWREAKVRIRRVEAWAYRERGRIDHRADTILELCDRHTAIEGKHLNVIQDCGVERGREVGEGGKKVGTVSSQSQSQSELYRAI